MTVGMVVANAEIVIVALPGSAGRSSPELPEVWIGRLSYGRALPTLLKVLVSLVPTVVTAVTMTTATRPAMRPYSMAVGPEASRTKREKKASMARIPVVELLVELDVRPLYRAGPHIVRRRNPTNQPARP